jgi:hypothetical protein
MNNQSCDTVNIVPARIEEKLVIYALVYLVYTLLKKIPQWPLNQHWNEISLATVNTYSLIRKAYQILKVIL